MDWHTWTVLENFEAAGRRDTLAPDIQSLMAAFDFADNKLVLDSAAFVDNYVEPAANMSGFHMADNLRMDNSSLFFLLFFFCDF